MVQLDALRAFAVFGVLFFHFYQRDGRVLVPVGVWGVRLFFVLSGFLITGILLNCRGLSSTRSGG
jgi:peptidoglycan/LPS O-acetylase OafA/YrhL